MSREKLRSPITEGRCFFCYQNVRERRRRVGVSEKREQKKMDNPFDCLSDDYQTRVEEKAAAEAIMATKVRLQVQF